MKTLGRKSEKFFIPRESLGPYTKISFLAHFFLLIATILFQKGFNLLQPNATITTVIPSIRVDVVGMPKMTLQELKKLSSGEGGGSTSEEDQSITKEESDSLTFKKKGKNLSEILRLEALKKISLKEETQKTGKGGKGKIKGDLSELVLEGNKISKGMAIIGDTRGMVMGAFGQYVSSIPDFVRPNWKLPATLLESNLNCRVRIYLNADGKLEKAELFESSGNKEYDKRAIQAVMNSSFPKPSKEIIDKVRSGNILLGFPL
jgi:colicin import membrane protein